LETRKKIKAKSREGAEGERKLNKRKKTIARIRRGKGTPRRNETNWQSYAGNQTPSKTSMKGTVGGEKSRGQDWIRFPCIRYKYKRKRGELGKREEEPEM